MATQFYPQADVSPPSLLLALTELPRAIAELTSLAPAAPLLAIAPMFQITIRCASRLAVPMNSRRPRACSRAIRSIRLSVKDRAIRRPSGLVLAALGESGIASANRVR
jgi:hypothetical protein